ncbi:ferritin-like domain-containing protein [Paracoccus tegillarcae]|uniref:YciE/YciF family protein n=1 Tax=Paracoccus tegillarcae TaxID=1529068 RepID=A0A2K9EF12_9RHOB|nr:ferritin-like domain-containing protein [Paracoccus tegillarcae]AUH33550.1 YciE/YciF family protein [Paracoccus tegillarcae]
MKTLADAFSHTLKDIYYAENAILKAGPKVAKAVKTAELKKAIEGHMDETRQQVDLLKDVFKVIGEKPEGEKCDAIEGLIKECEGVIDEAEGVALEAAVVGCLQAIEHYEIARYGTLREWAKELGHKDAADILGRILDMEKAANNKLTGLAVTDVNT